MKKYTALFLLLLISGCATSSDFDLLRQDMNAQRRESLESKKEIASLREQNAAAAREIEALKEKTTGTVKEDSFTAVRENQADITSRLAELSNSLQDLRGRFEENKYNLEKILRDSATERDLLRAQMAALEAQVKTIRDRTASPEEGKTKEASKKGLDTAKPEQEKGSAAADDQEQQKSETASDENTANRAMNTEKEAYDAAYQAFKNKKFRVAREKFSAFLKDYHGSKLADSAQFWIAESFYGEKDYDNAILAYETVLKKYPGSKKIPGALLKQGFAFIEMGDVKTGKTILRSVIDKFPDSKEAAVARKRIAEFEKKPGRKK